jgi:Domain of unknown function (DUF1844)
MEEEQATFKVTDRRLFNADGTPRDVPPEEKPDLAEESQVISNQTSAAAKPATASEPKPAPATEASGEAEIPDVDDPAGFINFAMSIASNAASALGMMEHPVTRKREVDVELAKHWIDVLGMLQRKTRGNLTVEEAQILEGWLADLRMQYVSLTSTASSKTARSYTGRDITGGR